MPAAKKPSNVATVLDAIHSGSLYSNHELLTDDLRRRAFALGVVSVLDQFYTDPESEKEIRKYLTNILLSTIFVSDPKVETPIGRAFLSFSEAATDVLETHNADNVSASRLELEGVLEEHFLYFSKTLTDIQSIIRDVSRLSQQLASDSNKKEIQHKILGLLEVCRRKLSSISS
jgi:hypothetical protein